MIGEIWISAVGMASRSSRMLRRSTCSETKNKKLKSEKGSCSPDSSVLLTRISFAIFQTVRSQDMGGNVAHCSEVDP
jgi:hypothetical protein